MSMYIESYNEVVQSVAMGGCKNLNRIWTKIISNNKYDCYEQRAQALVDEITVKYGWKAPEEIESNMWVTSKEKQRLTEVRLPDGNIAILHLVGDENNIVEVCLLYGDVNAKNLFKDFSLVALHIKDGTLSILYEDNADMVSYFKEEAVKGVMSVVSQRVIPKTNYPLHAPCPDSDYLQNILRSVEDIYGIYIDNVNIKKNVAVPKDVFENKS